MAIKRYVLVDKITHNIIYNGQIFEIDDTLQDSPEGLLGGTGQKDWYWSEVTNFDSSYFDADNVRFIKVTRTPPDGENINAEDLNVVVTNGTWS